MYILWFSFHGARASFLKPKNEFFAKMQKSQKNVLHFWGWRWGQKKNFFLSKCLELWALSSVKISLIFEKFDVRTWWVLVDTPIYIIYFSKSISYIVSSWVNIFLNNDITVKRKTIHMIYSTLFNINIF